MDRSKDSSGKKKCRETNSSPEGQGFDIRALAKRVGGQSFVEFALVLPVFLMLVLGILDMARAYSALQIVTNAAREGARTGIISASSSADVTSSVDTYLGAGGQTGCATTGSNLGGAGTVGDSTTVTVSCDFATLTGAIIPIWTGIITLTRTAAMRHE